MKIPDNALLLILIESIPAICIGLFGGFVELMLRSEDSTVSLKFVISTLIVAGFVGMIVSLLIYDYDLSPSFKGALVGVAGASSRTVMELLKKWGRSAIKRILGD